MSNNERCLVKSILPKSGSLTSDGSSELNEITSLDWTEREGSPPLSGTNPPPTISGSLNGSATIPGLSNSSSSSTEAAVER